MKSKKKKNQKVQLNYDKLLEWWALSKDYIVSHKKKIAFTIFSFFIILVTIVVSLNAYYSNRLSPYIKSSADIESLEPRSSALILGAGLTVDGTPSDMLKDRLDTGFILLMQGKVAKLILSGDNREVSYNEPEAMKNYLIKRGAPEYALVTDYAGRRTYDSCYRAKEIFSQTKIYVVTQDFHITRSIFLCRSLGIDAVGVTSDLSQYPGVWENVFRDYIGMVGAFWDAKLTKPTPVLGEKIDIR